MNEFTQIKKHFRKSLGCHNFYWYKHGNFNVLIGIRLVRININLEYSSLYFYSFGNQPLSRIDTFRIENKIKNNLEKFGNPRISRLFRRILIIENPKYFYNTKTIDKVDMYDKESQRNTNSNESVFTFAKKINYKDSNISSQLSKTAINPNNSQKDTSSSLKIPSNYGVDMSYSHSNNNTISSYNDESVGFSLVSNISKNENETIPLKNYASNAKIKIGNNRVTVNQNKYVSNVVISKYNDNNEVFSTNSTVYEDNKKLDFISIKV